MLHLTEEQKNTQAVLIVGFLFGIFLIAAFNPRTESFFCDENYNCINRKTYVFELYNIIKKKKKIKVSPNDYMSVSTKVSSGKNYYREYYHLTLHNNSKDIILFRQPSASKGRDSGYGDENLTAEIVRFDKYLMKPKLKYSTTPYDNGGNFTIWSIILSFFMTGLIIWNLLDKNKN